MLTAATMALTLCYASTAMAQERGTKDEAQAMVAAAVDHVKQVGPEQAFKDFTTDKARWTKKDLYVIAFDMKANMKAHGANEKLIGKNHIDMKDANGVMFTAEMVKLAQSKGEGWVDYQWVHPQTNKISPKSSYVRKLANYDGFVLVGIYR
jgi:signal transduction histidine kinase